MESMQLQENPSPLVKSMAAFFIRLYSDQLHSVSSLFPSSNFPPPFLRLLMLKNFRISLFLVLYFILAELVDCDPSLAELVFSQPTQYLKHFEDAVVWAQVRSISLFLIP
ncbi:uncharacterized protein J3R85_002005 [Psidium guajava]|nr:uncharacterized protein J3R85_002005 [Psidium guajava]